MTRFLLPARRLARCAATLIALLGPAGAALAQPLAFGAPVLISTNGGHGPKLAISDNGNFVTVHQIPNTGVVIQRYDRYGVAIGSGVTACCGLPVLGMASNGRHYLLTAFATLHAFHADGTPMGQPVLRPASPYEINESQDFAVAGDGRSVAVWAGPRASADAGIYFQRYDATGQPVGAVGKVPVGWEPAAGFGTHESLAQGDGGFQRGFPKVAIDDAGEFVVAWFSHAPAIQETAFAAQVFRADGSPRSAGLKIIRSSELAGTVGGQNLGTTLAGGGQGVASFAIAKAPTGQALFAYAVDTRDVSETAPDNTLFGRPIGADGSLGDHFRLSPANRYEIHSNPDLAFADDGRLLFTYLNLGPRGNNFNPQRDFGTRVMLRVINSYSDAPTGDGLEIAGRRNPDIENFYNPENVSIDARDPSVAVDASGRVVVGWAQDVCDRFACYGYANHVSSDGRVHISSRFRVFGAPGQSIGSLPVGSGAGKVKVTTSGASTSTTPVNDGPAGVYSFNAQFCSQINASLYALNSQTVQLSNGNVLLNRTDPGSPAAGGVGAKLYFANTGQFGNGLLTGGECVTIPYRIGLQNSNRFTFTIDLRGAQ